MSLRQLTSPLGGSRWKLTSHTKENVQIVLPDLCNNPKITTSSIDKKSKSKRTLSNSSLMNLIPQPNQMIREPSPPPKKKIQFLGRTMSQSGIQTQLSATQMKFKNIIKAQTPIASLNTGSKNDQASEKFDKMIEIYELLSQLKQCKGNYSEDSMSLLPLKTDVKKALRALELLNEKGNPNSELMELVAKILRMATFSNKELLFRYESSLSTAYNSELQRIWKNEEADRTPYFILCGLLLEELKAKDRVTADAKCNYEHIIAELKQKIEDINASMEREINRINEEIVKKLHLDYEAKIKQLTETIEKQNYDYCKLQASYEEESKECQQLLNKLVVESNELQKANSLVASLQGEVKNHEQKFINTLKKLSNMHECSHNFRGTLDTILMQLFTIKQMVDHLKDQNNRLEVERDALKMKLNVGYDDLTPRPDYPALQLQHKVDFNVKLDNSKKHNRKSWLSTKSMFEVLLNKNLELQKAKKVPELEPKKLNLLTPIPPSRGAKRISGSKNNSPDYSVVQTKSNISKNLEPIDDLTGPHGKICESSRSSNFLITQDFCEAVNQHQPIDQEARSNASRRNSLESEAPEGIKIKINLAEEVEKDKESHEFNIIGNKIVAATQNLYQEVVEAKKIIETMDKEIYYL